MAGHEECVRQLLKANANVLSNSVQGLNAMDHAIHNANSTIAKLLEDAMVAVGANATGAVGGGGGRAGHMAQMGRRRQSFSRAVMEQAEANQPAARPKPKVQFSVR